MPDMHTEIMQMNETFLPELPTRIGLFGSSSGASVEATTFDVVVAIATSGGPIGG